MIAEKLEPVLKEIEDLIWCFEVELKQKPNYTLQGFRSALKIFMSVFMDSMWELQEKENMPQETREQMALKAGEKLKELIKTYTNIDTNELYK